MNDGIRYVRGLNDGYKSYMVPFLSSMPKTLLDRMFDDEMSGFNLTLEKTNGISFYRKIDDEPVKWVPSMDDFMSVIGSWEKFVSNVYLIDGDALRYASLPFNGWEEFQIPPSDMEGTYRRLLEQASEMWGVYNERGILPVWTQDTKTNDILISSAKSLPTEVKLILKSGVDDSDIAAAVGAIQFMSNVCAYRPKQE